MRNTQKPERRTVGKSQYLWIMGIKTVLYSTSISLVCLGIGMFAANIFGTVHDAFLMPGRFGPEHAIPLGQFTPNVQNYFLALGVVTGAVCLAIAWFGKAMFKKAQRIEPVALIRKSSAIPLPEAETLVRASDTPPTDRQELLRGTGKGSETPVMELLRAAHRNGRD